MHYSVWGWNKISDKKGKRKAALNGMTLKKLSVFILVI
jgi:hypothetical protein